MQFRFASGTPDLDAIRVRLEEQIGLRVSLRPLASADRGCVMCRELSANAEVEIDINAAEHRITLDGFAYTSFASYFFSEVRGTVMNLGGIEERFDGSLVQAAAPPSLRWIHRRWRDRFLDTHPKTETALTLVTLVVMLPAIMECRSFG
jgi:hypothetical protein